MIDLDASFFDFTASLKLKPEDSMELYIKDYNEAIKNNIKLSKNFLKEKIILFEKLFDIQQRLFKNHYYGTLDVYYSIQDYEKLMFQSYLKTISLLYNSHLLALKGSYGAANIILRQVFEFLLIGKYANTTKNNQWANSWLEMHQFNVYDKIIKMLEKPNKRNLHDYWIITCRQVHATSSSHQMGLSFKYIKNDIFSTYNFILLLLRCNYHLLSTCILNTRLRYRSEYYGNHKQQNTNLRRQAKGIIRKIENGFLKPGIDLMRDYRSSWKFKK